MLMWGMSKWKNRKHVNKIDWADSETRRAYMRENSRRLLADPAYRAKRNAARRLTDLQLLDSVIRGIRRHLQAEARRKERNRTEPKP